MHKVILTALGAASLAATPAIADPVALDDGALDAITAGDLGLPNGKVQFPNFDDPSPNKDSLVCTYEGMCHSTFNRSDTALFKTYGLGVPGVEGPWAAGRQSDAIECINCP